MTWHGWAIWLVSCSALTLTIRLQITLPQTATAAMNALIRVLLRAGRYNYNCLELSWPFHFFSSVPSFLAFLLLLPFMAAYLIFLMVLIVGLPRAYTWLPSAFAGVQLSGAVCPVLTRVGAPPVPALAGREAGILRVPCDVCLYTGTLVHNCEHRRSAIGEVDRPD